LWSAWRIRSGNELDVEVATARRAFLVTLGATASNSLTIASWAAIFAAASTGTHAGVLGYRTVHDA
jgi:putative LysE/RhtB family amino acid efflux pump